MEQTRKQSPIAIVAMGTTFPGRGTTHGFWRDIVEGIDASREIPATHWRVDDFYDPDPKCPDKTYSSQGAFIPAFPFDPVDFGTPPNVVETTDTVQLLALTVAKQVLADAQPAAGPPLDLERTSVVLGVAVGTELLGDMAGRLNRPIWIKAMREEGLAQSDAEAIANRISSHFTEWRENTFPGLLGNVVAGRIANRFGLGGTNFTTDAACASSLAAIRHAAQELWLGESDTVLAGGADALNNAFMYLCFSKTPAMSASGKCRPFSDDADGTLMGEGCGIFALRRLEDAQRDGNTILAVITGIGASSDGRGSSVYAPRADGQALAIRRALAKADISPRTVELMEAHGTGTRAGDAAEFKGLKEVFGEADKEAGAWCALGSIKSQIGHTKSAAGAAGLAKVVSALRHKVLPPTINVRAPNPALGIGGSSFYLNTRARPWVRGNEHPRRASLSSFGFGGTNFHITLEEHAEQVSSGTKHRTAPTELFLFSASSGAELGKRVGELAAAGLDDADLPHHAAASQSAFDVTAPHRLAFVVGSWAELSKLVEKLRPRVEGEQALSIGNAVYNAGTSTARPGKTAYLFSGQGSQYLGMGADLAMAFDLARAPWDWSASDPTLRSLRLHNLAFPPPAFTEQETSAQLAELTRTENTQPSIGLVELGQLGVLRDLALQPDCVAGHSFGEVMALHAAGALDAEAAIVLARARGEAMAQAASTAPGGMLAVFAERELVDGYLAERPSGLVFANDNAPGQIVLSGPVDAIEEAEKELSERGVRLRRLGVSTAFHSPLVAAATADLQAAISKSRLRAPQLPIYANLTGELYSKSETAAGDLLAQQLTAPVRFREMIENMYRDGVRTFVEVGPSSVLSGLVGSILKDRAHVSVALDQRQMHGVTALHHALAALAVAGHEINFDALWAEAPAPEPRREPKKHEIMLTGANYGKPYPAEGEPSRTPEPEEVPTLSELRAAAAKAIAEVPVAPEPASQPSERPAASAPADGAALSAAAETVRDVVAEKTGYPADMLDLGLDLEAELGIDSIKQVEILSALREKIPGMPEIEPARLAELRTLQLIAEAVVPAAPAEAAVARSSLNGASPPKPAASAPADGAALSAAAETVRDVVAEKTGYPADMLDLGLDLEAELGIDSIKQVEILSALREKIPDMPEIEPARLADLRTLQLIAEAVVPAAPAEAADVPPPAEAAVARSSLNGASPPKPAATAPADGAALSAAAETVRDVVAEKTGYPADMLDLGLDLEAELGIDSIKQVEILSALREKIPGMPEIEPARLAELRTLQLIAEAVVPAAPAEAADMPAPAEAAVARSSLNGASPPKPAASAPADGAALSAAAETVRDVVAEKTGYPADMLDLGLDLEAELGIDSIKQVEILSALREKVPGMPEIEPARLAELRTLQLIAEAVVPAAPAEAAAAPAETPDRSIRSDLSLPAFLEEVANHGLSRLVVDVEAASSSVDKIALSSGQRIQITSDAPEIADAIALALRSLGFIADVVDAPSDQADAVIVTSGLADSRAAEEIYPSALSAARKAAETMSERGGWFILLQDSGGDFGRTIRELDTAMRGGLTGLAKTAALEWPRAKLRVIDVDRKDEPTTETARRVVQEILSGGGPLEVGLKRDGSRVTPSVRPAAYTDDALTLEEGANIVVSGGGRGITARVIQRLAGLGHLRFLLLGRSELREWPSDIAATVDERQLRTLLAEKARANGQVTSLRAIAAEASRLLASREVAQTVAAVKAAGSEVTYVAVDIADASGVAGAVNAFREQNGPITGLIHGAGQLADKLIKDKTEEQLRRVFEPKVHGFETLWSAVEADDPSFVALFSSIVGRIGNAGQADYAMANEILNRFAWTLRQLRPQMRVMSINWGPWLSGMVTESLRAQFEERQTTLIPAQLGADAFVAELFHGSLEQPEIVFAGQPGAASNR